MSPAPTKQSKEPAQFSPSDRSAHFEIIKQGWWRPTYTIYSGDTAVGTFGANTLTLEAGTIEIGNSNYTVRGRGWFDKSYELQGENDLIYAWRPLPIVRSETTIEHNGRHYGLTRVSTLSLYMYLHREEVVIGTIRKAGFFSRNCKAVLPKDLPLQFQVFVIWLALGHKKHESQRDG